MKLLQVALLFTFVMLVAHVAASSNRKSQNDQTEEFQLEIPEHCKMLGFCEDIPNYPAEQAEKVISEISDLSTFQNDKLADNTRRVGPQEENLELCDFEEKVVYPKAAIDLSGKWHVVLNQDMNPLQGFHVEICKNANNEGTTSESQNSCAGMAVFVEGYEGRCIQKFLYRSMAVLLDDGSKTRKLLKIPSCCSCVGKVV